MHPVPSPLSFPLALAIAVTLTACLDPIVPHVPQYPAAQLDPARTLQNRITENVQDWLFLFERPDRASDDLLDFLADANVEVRVRDRTIRGRAQILQWAKQANSGLSQVHLIAGPIRSAAATNGTLDAHFDVDRRARDEEGLLRVSKDHHAWRIQIDEFGQLRLLEAVVTPTLPHPGTGTQILCL